MANWDERFFITELKHGIVYAPWNPVFGDKEASRLLCMDNEVIKGAFYMELAWFWPGKWPETKSDEGTVKTHTHAWDEAIAFVGTNPDDIYDLGGEIELWVDGKQNILNKSFVAYVPAGTQHGPLRILKVYRPIFHYTAGIGKAYV